MWQKFLRDYFTFSRRERNGLIVLLLILVAITFWPSIYFWLHKDEPTDFSAFERAVDSFQSIHKSSLTAEKDSGSEASSISELHSTDDAEKMIPQTVSLFSFDPNAISGEDWKKLGIQERTIQTIMKYRSKGGKFFNKEDLKKIYGFKETDYERLEPYIQLSKPSTVVKAEKESTSPIKKTVEKLLLELNSADSSQLEALNGIGAVLSSRILKFRNKLGGFVSADQLKDIYGLSPEIFDEVISQVTVDSSKIKKIDINSVSLDELKVHPYFKNPIASMVINYRNQHGPFHSPEDLENIDLITDELLKKMIPYVSF